MSINTETQAPSATARSDTAPRFLAPEAPSLVPSARIELREVPTAEEKRIRQQLGKNSETLARVLAARGAKAGLELARFLEPSFDNFADPRSIKDFDKLVEYISQLKASGRAVACYGDYDVDGVTSVVAFSDYLSSLGICHTPYFSVRERHGHGLHREVLQKLIDVGVRDLFVFDQASLSHELVAWLRDRGIHVTIIDHHHMGEDRAAEPNIFINPGRKDCQYAHNKLCTAGIVQALGIGLAQHFSNINWRATLDVTMLGTIADVVPLIDENRIIVAHGLSVLAHSKRVGIQALLKKLGFAVNPNESSVGFDIAPRLNAAGRMADAMQSYLLLSTRDPDLAEQIATEVDQLNLTRKEKQRSAVSQIDAEIKAAGNKPRALFIQGSYEPGIIGLIASVFSTLYNCPTLIAGRDNRVSARNPIDGFDSGGVLRACQARGYFVSAGGYPKAAGGTMREGKVAESQKFWDDQVVAQIGTEPKEKVVKADIITTFAGLNARLKELDRMAPYGQGNPEINLLFENLSVNHFFIDRGGHLTIKLRDRSGYVMWGRLYYEKSHPAIVKGNKVSICASAVRDLTHKGRSTYLKIHAITAADNSAERETLGELAQQLQYDFRVKLRRPMLDFPLHQPLPRLPAAVGGPIATQVKFEFEAPPPPAPVEPFDLARRAFSYPSNLYELREHWECRLLNPDTFQFNKGQVKCIIDYLVNSTRNLFVGETGAGKTGVVTGIAAHKLEKVYPETILFLVPTRVLAKQQAACMRKLLLLPPEAVACAIGGITKDDRSEIFFSPKTRIVVATPELILSAIEKGQIDAGRFTFVIYDECHHARGEHAYVRLAEIFNRLGTASVSITASPGNTELKKFVMYRALHIMNYGRVTNPQPLKHSVAHDLERDARIDPLLKVVVEHSRQFGVSLVHALDAFPRLQKIALGITGVAKGYYKLPSRYDLVTLRKALTHGRLDSPQLMGALSTTSALQECAHLRTLLEEYGIEIYLHRLAMGFYDLIVPLTAEDPADRRNGVRLCRRRVFMPDRNNLLYQSYLACARERDLPELPLKPRNSYASLDSKGRREKSRELAHARSEFLRTFTARQVSFGHYNPKAARTLAILQGHFETNPNERAIVYSGSVWQSNFYADILNAFAGTSSFGATYIHSTDRTFKDRDIERNLARFASGERRILVATAIIQEGQHLPGADIGVVLNSPQTSEGAMQLEGRWGRGKRASVGYSLFGQNSAEQRLYYRTRRAKSETAHIFPALEED